VLRVSIIGKQGRQAAVAGLMLSAAAALAIGTGVYLLDRNWSSVLFLAPVADWQTGSAGFFGRLGHSLPSLTHAYAFAVLIIVALRPRRRARELGALSWLIVACGLEGLQTATTGTPFVPGNGFLLAGWFSQFMMNGRFDVADIAATAAGVLAAYLATSVLETQQ